MIAARANWADWSSDVLPGHQQATAALGPDPDGEGEIFATLVRKPGPAAPLAVLGVHGFTDYFFNTELADHFAGAGARFYGLDLHKCGRSWPAGKGGYGLTLHRDYHGEFDYNLKWKPVGGFPITVGWITAIRRGQSRLHRGLDVGVPNLILRSDHSVAEDAGTDVIQRGDAVLDVNHIARWAGCVGNRQTVVPVTDAKHDVFLSLSGARAVAYTELDRWLESLHLSALRDGPSLFEPADSPDQ